MPIQRVHQFQHYLCFVMRLSAHAALMAWLIGSVFQCPSAPLCKVKKDQHPPHYEFYASNSLQD